MPTMDILVIIVMRAATWLFNSNSILYATIDIAKDSGILRYSVISMLEFRCSQTSAEEINFQQHRQTLNHYPQRFDKCSIPL
mmetsp:Transcript_3431/g.6949  ORF Transcript_3431/g.6949 Transcript_3431/m.6949 type:complete len:82 (-) Transcript_3431:1817-2062(-)